MPMQTIPASQSRMHADVRRLLGIMLQRDVHDPRLAGINITRTEAANRGRMLKVWVHGMDVANGDVCVALLNRLRPHLLHGLRRALPRRRLPQIVFAWDDALDAADRLRRLLRAGARL